MQTIWNATDHESNKRIVNDIVRQFDNTGTVTLATGTTSTVVVNQKVNPMSRVFLQAINSDAALDIVGVFVSAKGNGNFTITHPNLGTTRQFDYVIFGI